MTKDKAKLEDEMKAMKLCCQGLDLIAGDAEAVRRVRDYLSSRYPTIKRDTEEQFLVKEKP